MSTAFVLAGKVVMDTKGAANGVDDVTNKTSRLGKVGNAAGKLLAVGLLAAGAAAISATKAAAEDEAAASKLANTLKTVAGATDSQVAATETYIAAQGKLLGVTDDELRPALDSLVTATKDVNKAQELSSIAMDISAKRGISLESVSKKLAKAYTTGNTAALAAYGVASKDAAGNTKTLEQATAELAATYGGSAAAAADTNAGKQKILTVQMGELQEQIGAKLLPVMLSLTTAGLAAVDWISQNSTTVLILVGAIGGLLAVTFVVSKAMAAWAVITAAVSAAQGIYAAVTGASTATTLAQTIAVNAASAASKGFAIATGLLNAVMALNPVLLVVIAVVALAAALIVAYKKSETFRAIVDAVFGAVAATVSKTWNVIQAGASAVIGFLRSNWKLLLAILTGPIGAAVILIASNWDKIKAGFVAVKDKIAGVVGDIKTSVVNGFNAIASPIQAVIDKVQSLIDRIKSIPIPKIPDLNPFNGRTAARPSGFDPTTLGAAPGTSGGGGRTVVNINVSGAIDPRSTAQQIATMLRREGYRLGQGVNA